ncbi:amidohydrolase family protein [Pricia sp. S334]|uniref:Amidohydrolase family protein n=1 Tax=Pricia mediterranea TaxID=3076079 RepID=A0ABU3L5L2_9FLAO|nr:amidohydrolase family protein [Pricia sp. S334]MDT7829025.1 amidohydrolase family protein [Pricia sp. S334]
MKTLGTVWLLLLTVSAAEDNEFYTLEDFARIEKIDVHTHVWTDRDTFVEQAKKDNFRMLNIAVDLSKGQAFVEQQFAYCRDQKRRYPKAFEMATAFSIADWDNPNFVENTIAWLDRCFDQGAIAVKVWKNVGMVFRDKNGELVMVDDPRLDPIFDHLTQKGIPLIGHLGEPKNCWLPLEEMTVNNDRDYFGEHPEYHMYRHPELPSYEEQVAARDRMLAKHPDLIFMGAHMGSLEWNVDELAKRLDRFPNMSVDLAARMGQVFYQTIHDREKVRDFFIKYQDRILYATDKSDTGEDDPDALQKEIHDRWLQDWRFFVTDDPMTSERVSGNFIGLRLPKAVVDKIFRQNAESWLGMFAI